MALVSLDGHFLRVNRSLCRILGYTPQELGATTFQQLTHPEDLTRDLAFVELVLHGEAESYQMEKRYFHRHGQVVWVLLSVSLVRDSETQQPQFFISQIQDVTAQKSAEQIRDLLFQLPMALHFVTGFDGVFRRVSPSWTLTLGYSEEEFRAMTWLSLVHPEDVERTLLEAARTYAGEHSVQFENRLRHLDGSYRWILWNSISLPEQKLSYGVALDYTDRKQTELALQRTLEEKETLIGELGNSARAVQSLRDQLLTVCAWTKRIRYNGEWISTDEFLRDHLKLRLTHGISEEAMEKIFTGEKIAADEKTEKPDRP